MHKNSQTASSSLVELSNSCCNERFELTLDTFGCWSSKAQARGGRFKVFKNLMADITQYSYSLSMLSLARQVRQQPLLFINHFPSCFNNPS